MSISTAQQSHRWSKYLWTAFNLFPSARGHCSETGWHQLKHNKLLKYQRLVNKAPGSLPGPADLVSDTKDSSEDVQCEEW